MKNINSGVVSLKQLFVVGSIAALTWFVSQTSELTANDLCLSDGTFGNLDVNQVMQEEGPWCWVASTKVFLDRFEMRSQSMTSYAQCQLYNLGSPTETAGFDCCSISAPRGDNRCLGTGWPEDIMTPLHMGFTDPGRPLYWAEIKEQICPSGGSKGKPFVYVTRGNSTPIIPHTNVIKGFIEDPVSNTKTVVIDDHEISGFQDLDYDCWYVQICGNHAYRVGDRINISKPDDGPPGAPFNLRVQ